MKTPLVFVLRISEEGADPGSSPTEDGDSKRNLMVQNVTLKLNQLLFTKEMLRLFLVYDQAFLGQGILCLLRESRSALRASYSISEFIYVLCCTSTFLVNEVTGN